MLTVVSGVHGRVVLQVSVLVVRDAGRVGGRPAPRPAGGTVCKRKAPCPAASRAPQAPLPLWPWQTALRRLGGAHRDTHCGGKWLAGL